MDAQPRLLRQNLLDLQPNTVSGGKKGHTPPPHPPGTASGLDIHGQPPELYSDSTNPMSGGGSATWRDQNNQLNADIQSAFANRKGSRANLFVLTWRMYPNAAVPKPATCGCGCSCS
jgi:hypothetical protein